MTQHEVAALMGTQVVVSAEYERVKEDTPDGGYFACWEARKRTERAGWVVGIRYLPAGRKVPETPMPGYYDPEWDGRAPTHWKQEGKPLKALLVCVWPSEQPWLVPMDAWRKRDIFDDVPHPSAWGVSATEVAHNKAKLAAWNTENPQWRDAKGRFTRFPKAAGVTQ